MLPGRPVHPLAPSSEPEILLIPTARGSLTLPGIQMSAVELELHPRYNGIRDGRRFQDVIRRRITFEEQAAREAKAEGPWPY